MAKKLFPNQVSIIQIAQGYFYYCLAVAKLSQKSHSMALEASYIYQTTSQSIDLGGTKRA